MCALTEEVETGTFTMRVPHGLSRLAQASTIIIPGTADLDVPIDPEIIEASELPRIAARASPHCASAHSPSPTQACSTDFARRRTGRLRRSWPAGTRLSTSTLPFST